MIGLIKQRDNYLKTTDKFIIVIINFKCSNQTEKFDFSIKNLKKKKKAFILIIIIFCLHIFLRKVAEKMIKNDNVYHLISAVGITSIV